MAYFPPLPFIKPFVGKITSQLSRCKSTPKNDIIEEVEIYLFGSNAIAVIYSKPCTVFLNSLLLEMKNKEYIYMLSPLIFVTFSGLENSVTKMRNVTKVSVTKMSGEIRSNSRLKNFRGK